MVLLSLKIAVLCAPLLGILGRTVKNENQCLEREGKTNVHSFLFGKEISQEHMTHLGDYNICVEHSQRTIKVEIKG